MFPLSVHSSNCKARNEYDRTATTDKTMLKNSSSLKSCYFTGALIYWFKILESSTSLFKRPLYKISNLRCITSDWRIGNSWTEVGLPVYRDIKSCFESRLIVTRESLAGVSWLELCSCHPSAKNV